MKTFGALAVAAVLMSGASVASAADIARDAGSPVVVVPEASVSPEKRALAAQVVRLTTVDMEKQILDYMGTMFAQVDSDGGDRSVMVWFEKNAGPIMLPHIRVFMSEVELLYARLLSVEELRAMVAFYDTPMGRSIARKQTQLGIDMAGPIETMTANYTEDLMTRFCSDNECPDMEDSQPAGASKSTRH